MDDADLTAAFRAHKEGSTKFTRRMAINMADFFDVSVRQLVARLEQLKLLKAGSWDWFRQNGGFTREHYEIVRAERNIKKHPERTTLEANRLSHVSTKQDNVSRETYSKYL